MMRTVRTALESTPHNSSCRCSSLSPGPSSTMRHRVSPQGSSRAGTRAYSPVTKPPSRAKRLLQLRHNGPAEQGAAKPLDEETIALFQANLAKSGILPKHILPHDSYLINLGHPEEEKRQKSLEAFIDEVNRCSQLGLDRLNFHPGSHLKQINAVKRSVSIVLHSV